MRIVAQWRRGVITKFTEDGVTYAEKTARFAYTRGAIAKEAVIVAHLDQFSLWFRPRLAHRRDDGFVYHRVEGTELQVLRDDMDLSQRQDIIAQLLDVALQLDQLGVVHGELQRPTSNVLVQDDGRLMLLDFERGTLGDYSGKNLKAIWQWLLALGIVDVETLRSLSRRDVDGLHQWLAERVSDFFAADSADSTLPLPQPVHVRSVWEYLWVFGSIVLWVGLDQATKWRFYDLELWSHFWFLTPTFNPWSAWSLSIDLSILIAFGVVVVLVMSLMWYYRRVGPWLFILMAAGAVGNLIDRMFWWGVRDFVDLQYWPIFNLADVYLTGALVLYIRSSWHLYKRFRRQR